MSASGNSASCHPQYLSGDSLDCCTEWYEIVVYYNNAMDRRAASMWLFLFIFTTGWYGVFEIEFSHMGKNN